MGPGPLFRQREDCEESSLSAAQTNTQRDIKREQLRETARGTKAENENKRGNDGDSDTSLPSADVTDDRVLGIPSTGKVPR